MLRNEQKDLVKQLYDIQRATEKMHLESETLKVKNSEIMSAVERVKQNPDILKSVQPQTRFQSMKQLSQHTKQVIK